MNVRILAAALSAVASSTAVACVPYVQPSYIYSKNPYDIQLEKDAAIKQVVESVKDLLPPPAKFDKGTTTLEAEIIDFTNAANSRCAAMPEDDRKKLIADFSDIVTKWRNGEILGDRAVDTRLIPLPVLPPELEEFKLYLEGYDYLLRENPDHIPPAWEKLLKLPENLRTYRTVWVHFMLGNHFKRDLHTHYDNCRNAVRQGFVDTPGLALRSYTLEIRYGHNMTRTIRRAAEAELCQSNIPFLDSISIEKINQLDDGAYYALLEDPVCREFLALLDDSGRFRNMIQNQKLRNADICAYYSYNAGDIAEALKFIKLLEKPTLLSVYLEAKIARFNNNTPLVVEKLQLWLKMLKEANLTAPPTDLTYLVDPNYSCNEPESTEQDVYGMLGSAMVSRRDFMEAAKFFYDAGQETDLQDIAEQFMTTEQLFAFVDSIAEDAKKEVPQKHEDGRADYLHKYAIAKSITYLAARRAFREEKFDSAIKYMPSDAEKELVTAYVGFIRKGNDTSLDGNSRALALYNAAKILKSKGMELCGTAGSPDFYPGRFGFTFTQCRDCNYLLATGEWILCSEHRDMTITHPGFNSPKNYKQVTPHIRYHYRYQAAELALRAGILAKDEQLRALIYLFGGHCLRRTSPQEADIFYKRLVRECRKSKLGKLADAARWFPTITALQKEMNSTEPCDSLDKVYELMKKSFPKEK